MPGPTTSADERPPAPEGARRDLRDVTWFRWLALLVLLGFTFLVMKACSAEDTVSQQEAVAIAEKQVGDFPYDDVQVRFVRQGIPSRGYWAVSFYTTSEAGTPLRIRLVLVDAETGQTKDAAATRPPV